MNNLQIKYLIFMLQTVRLKELSRDKFLTPDECARLCSAPARNSLMGMRDYAILKVMLNCGLRKNEIIELRVKDFQRQGNEYWLVVHSKGGDIEEQDILSDRAITAIQRYLKKSGHADKPDDPLFQPLPSRVKTDSKKISRRSIDFFLEKYVKRAGIGKHVHAHMLRHTFGTELQALTGDIKLTQKAMRHKNLNSTMIYLHVDRERVKQGLSKLNL